MASAKTAVDSFREVAQDLLVPELKAVKVSVDSLRNDMRILNDSTREEMTLTKDALREEMKIRNEGLERRSAKANAGISSLFKASLKSWILRSTFASGWLHWKLVCHASNS